MMRATILPATAAALALAAALAAVASAADTAALRFEFECEGLGSVEASFGEEEVLLSLPDEPGRVLPQLRSGSGARYGAEGLEFWTKGDGAVLTRTSAAGTVEHTCHVTASLPPAVAE